MALSLRSLLFAMLSIAATSAYSASKTVLVLGDSLSAEYGLVRGTGWVALLEARLKSQSIDAAVVNASISGETSSGGKARLPTLLNKHNPSIVVIELGANDGLRGLQIDASKSNLHSMIVASQKTKAKVILVGMRLPPNYGSAYTENFFSMYAKLAKKTGAALVPFLFEGVEDNPTLFQSDRIHPTAAAQPTMLDNVWPHLRPLLK